MSVARGSRGFPDLVPNFVQNFFLPLWHEVHELAQIETDLECKIAVSPIRNYSKEKIR